MFISGIFAWLQEWAEVLSAIGSIGLTAGLVYLYWRQQGLLKRELNRDVRQQHTDTLRKRIRAWHGDIDEIDGGQEADFFSDQTNLPTVRPAGVEPAPAEMDLAGRDDDFRVVPAELEDDRYLEDLLENHAPELQELKAQIERQHREFQAAKAAFRSEFTGGPEVETDAYTLNPTRYFDDWVFKTAVRLNRAHLDTDKDTLRSVAKNGVEGEKATRPDEGTISYTADGRGSAKTYTYRATLKSGDLSEYNEHEVAIKQQVVAIYHDAIDDIGDEGVYQHAVQAAGFLDEMAATIEELKRKLIEYEGHPLYTGDCPYLDDATV